jgi:hypothetical protein
VDLLKNKDTLLARLSATQINDKGKEGVKDA